MLASERTCLIFGSTLGSPAVMEEFFVRYAGQGFEQTPGTDFLKVMGHTTAVNAALFLGVSGRVESLSAACATSAQCVGSAFEAIREGRCDVALAGGAEELHPATAGTFDILGAASRAQDPAAAPRPFDQMRDGLVLGEGGAALVLEEYEQAKRRQARIYAEVIGYATTCSAGHMTAPSAESMQACMQRALDSARITAQEISAVNGHATGTLQGDAAEALATLAVIGHKAPVTAFKGNLGHTLAASGAMETIGILGMMANRMLWPIRNLSQPLAEGQELEFLLAARTWQPGLVLKNTFAFGGINASLVLAPV
jgi:3-oxoacyl-[acyl-carrier-protein] synthase II